MCKTKKTKTIQSKIATIAATLIASCLLPHTTSADFGHSRQFKAAADQTNFDIAVSPPIEFLASSLQLSGDAAQATNFDMRTVATATFTSPPLGFKVALQSTSVEMLPAVPVKPSIAPVEQRPIAHKIDADKRSLEVSPARSASYGPSRLEANVARINFDTPSLAPMSFTRFCAQYPQDCKANRMVFRPKPVELTKARIAELAKVNREVNRAIKPKDNPAGVLAEEWLIAPREGDCKDYAITKRHELLARGWPSRSLLLAEVVVPSGEHHVVLVVRTRENDLVLDNLNWNVRAVAQIGYQWVRAQQQSNPKFWSTISVARATRVAMNAH